MKKIFFLMMLLGLAGCGENNDSTSPSTQNVSVQKTALTRSANLNNTNQVCSYNFDTTADQFEQLKSLSKPFNDPNQNVSLYSLIDGQRVSSHISQYREQTFMAMSYKVMENAIIQYSGGVPDLRGDHFPPTKGTVAYEVKLKILPHGLRDENASIASGLDILSYVKNLGMIGLTIGFGTTTDNTQAFTHDLNVLDRKYPLNITSNEYQRVGIYINQDTQQVGSIINGYDLGYSSSFKLPNVLDNIAFSATTVHVSAQEAEGKELSLELITDRNALEFKYPEGTTDICGNLI